MLTPSMTILVDSAEKTPYFFDVPTKVVNLGRVPTDTGDYSVEGSEKLIRAERKGFDDLFACLSERQDAFKKQLKRLVKYKHHILLLDTSVEALMLGSIHCKLPGGEALSRLMRLSTEYGISPVFCGRHGSRVCQTWLAHAERRVRDGK